MGNGAAGGAAGEGGGTGEDDAYDPLDAFMTDLQAPSVQQVRICVWWWRIGRSKEGFFKSVFSLSW